VIVFGVGLAIALVALTAWVINRRRPPRGGRRY
jgi:hypothetical protein